ncbi:MAG: hypothetical protein AAGF83_10220 [Cyanobacteria bacterium P01_G01_bin.67]
MSHYYEASGKTQPLKAAIPELKGQIILQGESRLGKSLCLRHLVKADTGDHTVSDRFVQLLRTRKAKSQ